MGPRGSCVPPFLFPSEKLREAAGERSNTNLSWKSDNVVCSATACGTSASRRFAVRKGWLCFPCQLGPTLRGASGSCVAGILLILSALKRRTAEIQQGKTAQMLQSSALEKQKSACPPCLHRAALWAPPGPGGLLAQTPCWGGEPAPQKRGAIQTLFFRPLNGPVRMKLWSLRLQKLKHQVLEHSCSLFCSCHYVDYCCDL